MPYARTLFVTTPTGWDRQTVREYAEHRIRRDDAVQADCRVTLRLELDAEQPNRTTRWRVTYVVHQQ